MSRSLELPDPVFNALEQAASASGTTPVGWITAHLPDPPEAHAKNVAESLADLFAGHIGGISSSGNESLSENCGERFTDYVEQKRREGRL